MEVKIDWSLGLVPGGIMAMIWLDGPATLDEMTQRLGHPVDEMTVADLVNRGLLCEDGGVYSVVQPGKIDDPVLEFDKARQLYRKLFEVPVRSLTVELAHFKKKHRRWQEIVPLLCPAIEAQAEQLKLTDAKHGTKSIRKYFQGWITESRWTLEVEVAPVSPQMKKYRDMAAQRGFTPVLDQQQLDAWIGSTGAFAGIRNTLSQTSLPAFFWECHKKKNVWEALTRWKS